MGLLSSIFGGDKKNSTTNTTNATQNTSNISADAGSILAQNSNLDFRTFDSRDFSTQVYDNSARSYSSVQYTSDPDVLKAALANADAIDERRSADYRFGVDKTYNASLAFFDKSAEALRDSYSSNAETLADTTVRTISAIEEANRSDGQAILSTVEKFGVGLVILIAAGIIFRSA